MPSSSPPQGSGVVSQILQQQANTSQSLDELSAASDEWILYQWPTTSPSTYKRKNTLSGMVDDRQPFTNAGADAFWTNWNNAVNIFDSTKIGRGVWVINNVAPRPPMWSAIHGSFYGTELQPNATFTALDQPVIAPTIHDGFLGKSFPGTNNGQNNFALNVERILIRFPVTQSVSRVAQNLGTGILLQGCGYDSLENIRVENAKTGLDIEGQTPNLTQGAQAVQNTIHKLFTLNCAEGLRIDGIGGNNAGANGAFITDSTFLNSGVDPSSSATNVKYTGIGAHLLFSGRSHFHNCKFQNLLDCFVLDPNFQGPPDSVMIGNPEYENCQNGMHFTGQWSTGYSVNIYGHFGVSSNVNFPMVSDPGSGFQQVTMLGSSYWKEDFCLGDNLVTLPSAAAVETSNMVAWRRHLDTYKNGVVPISCFVSANVCCEKTGTLTLRMYDVDQWGAASVVYSTGAINVQAGVQQSVQHSLNADCTYGFLHTPSGDMFKQGNNPRSLRFTLQHSAGPCTVRIGNVTGDFQGVSRI